MVMWSLKMRRSCSNPRPPLAHKLRYRGQGKHPHPSYLHRCGKNRRLGGLQRTFLLAPKGLSDQSAPLAQKSSLKTIRSSLGGSDVHRSNWSWKVMTMARLGAGGA